MADNKGTREYLRNGGLTPDSAKKLAEEYKKEIQKKVTWLDTVSTGANNYSDAILQDVSTSNVPWYRPFKRAGLGLLGLFAMGTKAATNDRAAATPGKIEEVTRKFIQRNGTGLFGEPVRDAADKLKRALAFTAINGGLEGGMNPVTTEGAANTTLREIGLSPEMWRLPETVDEEISKKVGDAAWKYGPWIAGGLGLLTLFLAMNRGRSEPRPPTAANIPGKPDMSWNSYRNWVYSNRYANNGRRRNV